MGKLLRTVLMMFAETRMKQHLGRIFGAVKWAALALLCGIGAGVTLIAALWVFLIPRIGAEYAALSMAGLLGVLCAAFAFAARAALHPRRRPNAEQDAALAEFKEVFSKHRGTALLSAVIAGLAMGNSKK